MIRRNGVVEEGRPIEQSGAHVAGHNHDSIGICLVGGDPVRAREWFERHAGQGYDLLGLLGHVWRRWGVSSVWHVLRPQMGVPAERLPVVVQGEVLHFLDSIAALE